jgi:hypothetical protein
MWNWRDLAQFWGLEKKENQWSRSYSFEFKQKAKKQQAYKQSILEPKAKHPEGAESKDQGKTKEVGHVNLLKRIGIHDNAKHRHITLSNPTQSP